MVPLCQTELEEPLETARHFRFRSASYRLAEHANVRGS
jgi:hypothetical protein